MIIIYFIQKRIIFDFMPFIFIFYSCVNKIQPFGKQLDVNHILITALFVCIMIVHYFIVQHTYYYLNYDFNIHPCRPSINNYNRRPLRPAIIRSSKGWGRILMCVLCYTISLWHKVIKGPSHYFFGDFVKFSIFLRLTNHTVFVRLYDWTIVMYTYEAILP